MKLLKILCIALTLFFLAGCSGKLVALKNDAGEVVTCEVGTGTTMLAGGLYRDIKIKTCVDDYESKGYEKIEE